MKCFTCGSNDIHELIEVISQKFKDVNIEATCISNVCDKCGVSFTNNNELRENLGNNGKQKVFFKFHYSRLVSETDELYQNLIQNKIKKTGMS